ncbi:hypothetical protein CsSME_00026610 [Camellia sinensis var. sinensis]
MLLLMAFYMYDVMTRKTYGQLQYFGGGLSIGWSKGSASNTHRLGVRTENALNLVEKGTCDKCRNVIKMRRVGVRPENATNLVEKGRFGVENSKQPGTTMLGVRAKYALNIVERGRSEGKNSKQPLNHCVALTESFPLTNRTCDNCQNLIRTCRLGVRPKNALNLVKKRRFRVKNSKQPQNHHVAITNSFPLTNRTCDS